LLQYKPSSNEFQIQIWILFDFSSLSPICHL
jgi:hypothetical protein